MSRRDWYRDFELPSEEHPVDLEIQARLEDDADYQNLRTQVLDLGGMLSRLLDGETLQLWLRVEAAINDRWAAFAEEAYNVGMDAGLARHAVDDVLSDASISPAAAVRALSAALARIAERIEPTR